MATAADPSSRLTGELCRDILETVDVAIVTVDELRRIAFFNPQAERLFGSSSRDVHGQPLTLLLPDAFDDDRLGHVPPFGGGHDTPNAMGAVFGLIGRRKNGDTFPVEVCVSTLARGDSTMVTMVVRDMTTHQRAERLLQGAVETERQRRVAALRDSEERFRAQYANSPIQVYTYQRAGDDFRLADCNDAARRATDGRIDQLMGTSVRAIYADRPEFFDVMNRCFLERRVIRIETEFAFRSTGTWKWVAASFAFAPPDLVMIFVDDITDRKDKEQEIQRLNDELEQRVRDRTRELAVSKARLADAQEVAHIGSWEYDTHSHTILRSAELCRMLGLPPDWADRPFALDLDGVHPADRERLRSSIQTAAASLEPFSLECRLQRPQEADRLVHIRGQAVRGADGAVRVIGTSQDITERHEVERELNRRGEMLRQSQKMEAVGMLAGGVAHDFNNLMTIIRGHGEELMSRLPARDPGQRRIGSILFAVDRAAALTAQLLAFGRKQPHQPKPIDLDEVIGAVEDMLARLGGRRNKLVRCAEPGLRRIWADRGQIEQILMNLVANARDAMPDGGPIIIETGNVLVDEPLAGRLGAPQGEYVTLVVRDEGVGMGEEVQSHVFEPFFTTKPIGKGTGLGLSTVYGIVQQSGGYIALDSAPGRGTSVALYFPQFAGGADEDRAMADPAPAHGGSGRGETILIAEDEDGVREVVAEFLESRGYRVLTGCDGVAALRTAGEHAGPIDLLLTDVVMPVMNGPELAARLKAERTETKVLFMSGYMPGPARLGEAGFGEAVLIRKPFALNALASAVRDTLDATR